LFHWNLGDAGSTRDNGSGPGVHGWGDGVVQDFIGPGHGHGSPAGAILKKNGVGVAHWVHGAIWDHYITQGGPTGFLGFPIDKESDPNWFYSTTSQLEWDRQNFDAGCAWFNNGVNEFKGASAPYATLPCDTWPRPRTAGIWNNGTFNLNFQHDTSTNSTVFFPPAPHPLWQQGDIPLVGDWDCDNIQTVGVWRAGRWLLSNNNQTVARDFYFGLSTDKPIVGNWNGVCQFATKGDTVGVWRGGIWYLNNQLDSSLPEYEFYYGTSADTPLTGDWDGNGTTTIGIWQSAYWHLRNSNSTGPADLIFPYGVSSDTPITGDWNGDRRTSVGVWRSTTGRWFLNNELDSSEADYVYLWGGTGIKPIVGRWYWQ
jgi:hypothetical protein